MSEIDFEKLQSPLTKSIRARGSLNLMRILAANQKQLCGPVVFTATLDDENIFFDWNRRDNSYMFQTIIVCPGDEVALFNFLSTSESASSMIEEKFKSLNSAPQVLVLKPGKSALVPFSMALWDKKGSITNPGFEIVIEGFKIDGKKFDFISNVDVSFHLETINVKYPVDGFSSKNYNNVGGTIRILVQEETCSFLMTNNLTVFDENAGMIARDIAWNLILKTVDSLQTDLVNYNNRFQIITDVTCSGFVDLFVPQLPGHGQILLASHDRFSFFFNDRISFRLQLELVIHDTSSRDRVCESEPSSEALDKFSLTICKNKKLKRHMRVLISINFVTSSDETALENQIMLSRIMSLDEGQIIAAVNQIDQKVSISYLIQNVTIDSDDVFFLCCESNADLQVQVCFN